MNIRYIGSAPVKVEGYGRLENGDILGEVLDKVAVELIGSGNFEEVRPARSRGRRVIESESIEEANHTINGEVNPDE